MKMKILFIHLILTVVLLISLAGCASIDTIKELKREPEIMDISINIEKNAVNVDVILNNNVDITDKISLGEKYALIVKKNYENRDVNLKIIKNKEEISRYNIKLSK